MPSQIGGFAKLSSFDIFIVVNKHNLIFTPVQPVNQSVTFGGATDKRHKQTRLHSSRMRTARLLTVSQHALRRGRGSAQGGRCLPGGGVSAQ